MIELVECVRSLVRCNTVGAVDAVDAVDGVLRVEKGEDVFRLDLCQIGSLGRGVKDMDDGLVFSASEAALFPGSKKGLDSARCDQNLPSSTVN